MNLYKKLFKEFQDAKRDKDFLDLEALLKLKEL